MSTTVSEPRNGARLPSSAVRGAVLLDFGSTPTSDLPDTAPGSMEPDSAAPESAGVPETPESGPAGQEQDTNGQPRRSGMAGLVAELFEQRRRSKAAAAAERRKDREHKQELKDQKRRGRDLAPRTSSEGLLARSAARVRRGLGEGAFYLGIAGAVLGQTMWWSSTLKLPPYLAIAFSAAIEAMMISADQIAMDRRRSGRPAASLRILSWVLAAVSAGMLYTHFSRPGVVATMFGEPIYGGPGVGAAFAALTTGAFVFHTFAGNARVNDTLRDKGLIKPLGGARWLHYPQHALRAKRMLIDRPHLSVEQAWEATRAPRRATTSARGAYRLGVLRTLLVWLPYMRVNPTAAVPAQTEQTPTAPQEQEQQQEQEEREDSPVVPDEDDTERTIPALRAVGSTATPRSSSADRPKRATRKAQGVRASREEYIALARRYFAAHPEEPITVSRVEKAAGCSRATASQIANILKGERSA